MDISMHMHRYFNIIIKMYVCGLLVQKKNQKKYINQIFFLRRIKTNKRIGINEKMIDMNLEIEYGFIIIVFPNFIFMLLFKIKIVIWCGFLICSVKT